MNKAIYIFTGAFLMTFSATSVFLTKDFSPRVPASTDITSLAPAIDATATAAAPSPVLTQIDSLYTQAIIKENSLAQAAATYDSAFQQSITGRQSFVNGHPNTFMGPGNPYDTQYSSLLASKQAIMMNRQNNLTMSAMNILLLVRQNYNSLTVEQRNAALAKYQHLVSLSMSTNSMSLYTWPQANDPYLLAVPPGSFLGTPQVAMTQNQEPTYNPLTGMYSSSPVPGSADRPVDGLQNTSQPVVDQGLPQVVYDNGFVTQ